MARFRRFIPHLAVMIASVCAYYFYHSRTYDYSNNGNHDENHKQHESHRNNNGANSRYSRNDQPENRSNTLRHNSKKSSNCSPSEDSLKGKKYANSGCLVVQNGKILIIRKTVKGFTTSAIPGGRKNEDELSPCTAQRKTFELTGIEVTAIQQIMTTENGFVIFLCESKATIPQSGVFHKKKFSLAKPNEIKDYKYPKQLEEIKKYLTKK